MVSCHDLHPSYYFKNQTDWKASYPTAWPRPQHSLLLLHFCNLVLVEEKPFNFVLKSLFSCIGHRLVKCLGVNSNINSVTVP